MSKISQNIRMRSGLTNMEFWPKWSKIAELDPISIQKPLMPATQLGFRIASMDPIYSRVT